MTIKLKSNNYTIYEDFSVSVKCQNCGKIDNLKPEYPQAIKINQIEDAGNHYLCLNCWKKQQNEIKEKEKEEKRSKILRGQAFNKGVDVAITIYKNEEIKNEEILMSLIKKWDEKFQNYLKNEKNNNN